MDHSPKTNSSINTQIKTQIATVHDIPALIELVNSVYRGETGMKSWTTEADLLDGQRVDQEMLEEIISDPLSRLILFYSVENALIGCVQLQKQDHKCYLGMLSVHTSWQKSGLGKYILDYCERFAQSEFQSEKMTINVISRRFELIAYYQRRGYVSTGNKRPFPYGQPKYGIPKVEGLELEIFDKKLS